MTMQKTLDEWLSLAYTPGGDCPPAEIFLEAEWRSLGDDERRAVEAHVETCPACSVERDLARAFDEPAIESSESDAGLKRILRRIDSISSRRGRAGTRSGDGRLLRFPRMARALRRPAIGLAAAAVAVLAVGIVVQTRTSGPPALPDLPTVDVERGNRIEVVSPAGEVSEIPARFEWEPVTGAVGYEVSLVAVDETVLWRAESSGAAILLPAEIRADLKGAVLYYWRVEAFNESGSRIAWSSAIEFRAGTAGTREE